MARDNSGGFSDLVTQAKITNRLIAAQLRTQMSQLQLVALLASTDATAKEIAEILDTTPATVSVTLARIKKKKGSKKEGTD